MPITLSELTRKTRKITVDIGASEPLEVEYRIQAYTPEVESVILNVGERPAMALAEVLKRLVVSWNLVDDNGEMYPLDNDHLHKMPLQIMMSIFQAIAEDMRPNPATAGN